MSDELAKRIAALEHALHVLEEENSQLAERAEDSLLLGLISETSQQATSGTEMLETVLERIAILKSIPYASCARFKDNHAIEIATYTAFSEKRKIGYPLSITSDLLSTWQAGPCVVQYGTSLSGCFTGTSFSPRYAAVIPFVSEALEHGFFLFIVDSADKNYLMRILALLNHVVEIAISRYDNFYLLRVLTETNKNLETLVEQRTQDLVRTNTHLQQEMRERTASEKALQESHNTLTTLLDSVDAMIYAMDLGSGQVLFTNRRLQREIAQTSPEVDSTSFFQFADGDKTRLLLQEYYTYNSIPRESAVWPCHDEKKNKWYVIADRVVRWTDGRAVMLRIATDVTRVKKMENRLQHAQKMEAIGTLAGGIAHDFNNLLMGIQGRASIMTTEISDNHPVMEHIRSIESYIESAAGLTKQLLGFARGGKYKVLPRDINNIVTAGIELFGRTRKELTIHRELCPDPLVAKVDASQVEQILLNLLINGWQAMSGRGEMRVTTCPKTIFAEEKEFSSLPPGDYCCLAVSDSGIGMSEEIRQRVFDPFFTTKEKQRGTGLGLASAYGIAQNHGGTITAASLPGKGSTFTVYLPLTAEEAIDKTEAASGAPGGKETILLIDDEQMIREVGQLMLENLGYTVLLADNGQAAINLVKKNGQKISLIILDLIMPGMDGAETFTHLRKLTPETPVILSSGYSASDQAAEVMEKGCCGFLQKPFSLAELSEYLRRILDQPQQDTTLS